SFHHHPADTIPEKTLDNGAKVRVMMGQGFGLVSPVETFSETLYYEIDLPDGASIVLPSVAESGLYVVEGEVAIGEATSKLFEFSVLSEGSHTVTAVSPTGGRSRFAVIGGAPLGERHIRWNFVSSRKDRIAQAAEQWRNGDFPTVPGDETEHIPLPKELIF
ncbi:MAG: pirin-like C-terminal cupin domain-containing protein, partial [Pseudomonadota bacterium]